MTEETRNTEIECPKCGHFHKDSFEVFNHTEKDAGCWCSECGAELQVRREFSVTYYTTLKEAKP